MKFEFQPTLQGDLVFLRPLLETDFEDLYRVASDPLIWKQHPEHNRHQREVFYNNFFKPGLDSKGTLLTLETRSQEVIGSSRFYDLDVSKNRVAIGYSFLARKYWGHTYNKEMKKLMVHHAFQFVDTIIFHIGAENIRSQKAIQKIGAKFLENSEYTFPDGRFSKEVVYQITKN